MALLVLDESSIDVSNRFAGMEIPGTLEGDGLV